MLLGVAEADFRRSDEEETYDFSFYRKCWAVRRKRLLDGRALKVFIAKEIDKTSNKLNINYHSEVLLTARKYNKFISNVHRVIGTLVILTLPLFAVT